MSTIPRQRPGPWSLPLAGAALALALGQPAQAIPALLAEPLLWQLLCAFVLAALLHTSGLAAWLALRVAAGARSLRGLCWRLGALTAATAFVLPSTSARAALLLPVFLVLARQLDAARPARALALLFPTVILLSAGASLTGAGAHLVAADAMQRLGTGAMGFARWAVLAAPLALAACAAAIWLILRLFLTAAERRAPLDLPPAPTAPLNRAQRAAATTVLATITLWLAAPWLGLPPLAVAAAGALAATWRPWTGLGPLQALRQVDWRLLATLAVLMLLTDAVLAAGALEARLAGAVAALWPAGTGPAAAVLLAAVLAVLSHLLVASRTARAALLMPLVALPLAGAGADAALLVFVCVQGSGFCQSFAWSAKPVTIFARQQAFDHQDLLRLALPLGLVFSVLLMLCALWLWPALGLG